MQKVKKSSISDQVFDQLKAPIIKGEWKPGTKIPSENELTKILGVSRLSVREAIQKLISLELLQSRRGEGTYVKELSAGIYMNSLIPLFALGKADTLQVLEYRKIIEVGTIELVVERADKEDIALLEEILVNMNNSKNDSGRFAEKDLEFHMALAEITKNPVIIKSISVIKDALCLSMDEIVKYLGTGDGLYYHEKIILSIKSRDKDLAKSLMEEHLVRTIKRIKRNM